MHLMRGTLYNYNKFPHTNLVPVSKKMNETITTPKVYGMQKYFKMIVKETREIA